MDTGSINTGAPGQTMASSPFSSCTILWSTQGGRAKACARRTARMIRSRGISIDDGRRRTGASHTSTDISPAVRDRDRTAASNFFGSSFDDYGAQALLEQPSNSQVRLILAFVSTTGDAEHCDSIQATWRMLLQKSLPRTQLQSLRFAIFCLGDRAYGPTAFCAAGRKLAARWVQLGARPICPVGYGDDGTPNGGVFADLDIWLNSNLLPLFPQSSTTEALTNNSNNANLAPEPPTYRIKPLSDSQMKEETETRKEEWQMDDYRSCYNDFFATQAPTTAYQYESHPTKGEGNDTALLDEGKGLPLVGEVRSNERITAPGWVQNTRHISIRLPHYHNSMLQYLPYRAGDVATIMPCNSQSIVLEFLNILPHYIRIMADVPIEICNGDEESFWPRRCTLRGWLTYCADIQSLPEREDLRALSAFCNPQHKMGVDQRTKLISLSETAGAALFADYILREKRRWAHVLYDFDSIGWQPKEDNHQPLNIDNGANTEFSWFQQWTLEQLLSILPPIQPRHFSIASAPSSQIASKQMSDGSVVMRSGFELELCVALVEGQTPLGRSYTGLCSGYLTNCIPSETTSCPIRLWIRPGSFAKLPLSLSVIQPGKTPCFDTPIWCVGAGTGIAPLRSLIREREAVRRLATDQTGGSTTSTNNSHDQEDNMGALDNVLLFGCRKFSADFYYNNEWDSLVKDHRLQLLTAFSQDQAHKIYVHQVLRQNATFLLSHVLDRKGAIYVAGGAKMARAIKDELVEILAEALPGKERDAKSLLKQLHRAGRFSVEAWS